MTFDNSKENQFGEHPGQWALDSVGDVLEHDPLRILDIENFTQMLLNKVGLPSETDRATSNFEDLVFKSGRPFRDNYTEFAGRALPFLITASVGPVFKGSKVGLNKLSKLISNKKASKAFQRAANSQLKNITDDPTVIKNVSKLFKNYNSKAINGPVATKARVNRALSRAQEEGSKDALKYLDDIADVYTNPVTKYVTEKSKNLVEEGNSIDQIRGILKNEAQSLSNSSGIDVKDVNTIIDTLLNRKQYYQNCSKIARKTSPYIKGDILRNPDIYKQFAADNKINYNDIEKLATGKIPIDKFKEWDKLKDFHNTRWVNTQDMLSKLNKATIPNVNKSLQATSWEDIMSKLELPKEMLGSSIKAALVTKAPEAATTLIENKLDKKPEYTWKNALGDTIKDMLGLDWSNPERFNEHEINQYLQWAQDVGLMSTNQWENWTPRQKLLKVKQIADFAREFDNTGDDYDYKTLYGDTRKEIFKRK